VICYQKEMALAISRDLTHPKIIILESIAMAKKSKRPQSKSPKPTLRQVSTSKTRPKSKIDFYWIGLSIVTLVFSIIRLRLVSTPLERDEGEYAYIGKLMIEGIAPYKEAYNMKLPGTYGMYALFMEIFGQTNTGIHIGLALMNMATIIFIFLAFRKLFNAPIALFSACVYSIMALSPRLHGFAAHATHFVTFFVAMALYLLARFYETQKLILAFLTGIMLGFSFLMKQQAVFFIMFGGIAIILAGLTEKPIRKRPILLQALVYSAGALIPYILTILVLAAAGVFDRFWFWTVTYATKYAAGTTWNIGMENLEITFKPMWQEFMLFLILFIAGVLVLFFSKYSLRQKLFALTFALFSLLTVCPGLYFRHHYFICLVPAMGLMGGIFIDYLTAWLNPRMNKRWLAALPFIIFSAGALFAIIKYNDFYLKSDPNAVCKATYGDNPFIESIEIAKYISANTTKSDKIAVLGSEPQIFFYSDRHSATGYIYTYALMENHELNRRMQDEMIAEIEKNQPKILIYSLVSASWLRKEDSPDGIFNWASNYISQNYDLTGIIDVGSNQTNYVWNEDAVGYQHQSSQYLQIFKRKG
jgi:4-amino-4-deoxy-L-arabinose transferase-like glycosyltransferase